MGAVEIHGGHIVAKGGDNAAGLGGGKDSNSGEIVIYDGIVTAVGGKNAAGIGGGLGGSSEEITIYGGTVTATGGVYAAGIGGGECYFGGGSNGTLTIWGGSVTAYGGLDGAGIGAGYLSRSSSQLSSDCNHGGIVNIHGGHVKAYAGGYSASIGASNRSFGADVTITGGTVEAYPPTDDDRKGGGIGLGYNVLKGGSLTISGGEVISTCSGNSSYKAFSPELPFTLTGNMRVWAGSDANNATLLLAEERTTKSVRENYAHVMTCTDHTCNYITDNSGDYHIGTCIYCGHSVTEQHTIQANTNTCTVCGYSPTDGTWAVALWTPQLDADGNCNFNAEGVPVYQTAPATVFKNQPFHLPVCLYIPKGYAFAGWVVGRTISSLEAASDATLLQPGDSYTPTDDVEFTARYRQLNIILRDNGSDNDMAIWENTGLTATSVTLQDRVLCKDGSWNTLFLPFALSSFEGTPLEGATVKTLESVSFDESNGTLTLNFSEDNLTAIDAGTPYIVKWASGSNVTSPVFQNVTINAQYNYIDKDRVSFVGMYNTYPIPDEDKSMLYLGTDNTLYYPNAAMTIGACRAFFQVTEDQETGDVNGNGNIDVADLTKLVNYILGIDNVILSDNADVNSDEAINVTDVAKLVNILLGNTKVINVVTNIDDISYGSGSSL